MTKNGLPSVSSHEQARERDALVFELGTARCGEQRLHALLVEPVEIDALDAAAAPQIGEYSRERMPAVDVGVAVGHDDQHGRLGREVRDGVAEELNAGRVGPVRVVEHEHERLLGRDRAHEIDHRVEEQEPFGLGIGDLRRRHIGDTGRELGHDARELAAAARDVLAQHGLVAVRDQRSQRLDPRRECTRHVLVAATEQDEPVVRRARRGRAPRRDASCRRRAHR